MLPRILSDAMVRVARDLYVQGAEAMAQGRPADARAAFFGAMGLNPHYSIYCNLGDADMRLGRYTHAADEVASCVPGIEKDPKATDAERAAVKKLFAEAKAKVVELVTHSAREEGMPQVTTSVDTERATQNDELTMYLEPGKHVVRFEAEGYETVQIDFDEKEGARKELRPVWKKKAAAVPTTTATTMPDQPPAQKSLVPLIVLGAGAVVVAGIGGGILGGWTDKRAQVQSTSESIRARGMSCVAGAGNYDARCAGLENDARTAETLNRSGIGLLAGAGVLAAGAAAYWLFWPAPAQPRGATAVPVASPNGGGVVFVGRF